MGVLDERSEPLLFGPHRLFAELQALLHLAPLGLQPQLPIELPVAVAERTELADEQAKHLLVLGGVAAGPVGHADDPDGRAGLHDGHAEEAAERRVTIGHAAGSRIGRRVVRHHHLAGSQRMAEEVVEAREGDVALLGVRPQRPVE